MDTRSVMVVGGSRGIGAALASAYRSRGLRVSVLSRNFDPIPGVDHLVGDLRNLKWSAKVLDWLTGKAEARLVIVTAAQIGPVGPIDTIDISDVSQTLDLNVVGAFRILKVLVPRLTEQDRIVLFLGGGIGGPNTQPRVPAYTASKAAIGVLVETVGRDPAVRVPVVGLSPGPFPTTFTQPIFSVSADLAGPELLNQAATAQGSPMSVSRLLSVIDLICSEAGKQLSGRLVAANRDNIAGMIDADCLGPDIYRLRRVDQESILSQGIPT